MYVPREHGEHDAEPVPAANVPGSHDSWAVAPVPLTYEPIDATKHDELPVDGA